MRFKIHPLKVSSIYVSGVFGDSRGGRGTPGKLVPDGFFDKVGVLIFAAQNSVRSMFLNFLYIVDGGPLLNVFLRAYSTNWYFNFRPSKHSFFYVFAVFVHSRGEGGRW